MVIAACLLLSLVLHAMEKVHDNIKAVKVRNNVSDVNDRIHEALVKYKDIDE